MSAELSPAAALEASLSDLARDIGALRAALSEVLAGSSELIEGLLICLVGGGHGLIEGPPGVGKTIAVKALSACLGLKLTRVQMTPDLMPSDLLGSSVIVGEDRGAPQLSFKEGPIFTELLFADELNRANPRAQAALLEAMAERQVSVEGETRPLSPQFFVFATQNPIEVEGTFILPAAQADRFLCRLSVPLPSAATLSELLSYEPRLKLEALSPLIARSALSSWPELARQVLVTERLKQRLIRLVMLTRPQRCPSKLRAWISAGVSPRAAQDLLLATRARAAMEGRAFARDEDLEQVASAVLAHRLSLSWEARAEGISAEELVTQLTELSASPDQAL